MPGEEPPRLVGTCSTYWLIEGVSGGGGGGGVAAEATGASARATTAAGTGKLLVRSDPIGGGGSLATHVRDPAAARCRDA